MLTLLLGTDWVANRDMILQRVAVDVKAEKNGCILLVPELISHDMERRLCASAGDTASRFAEVLSFSRLVGRVSEYIGHAKPDCLDNGGRVVALAAAARQLHSKLKSYASVETRPEFLTGLLDAIDEFKRCCISARDLMEASSRTEGSLAQKLEELSLLLEAYDSLCHRGKRDPRDQMNWLLEQLEDSDFSESHRFYIDGFPDFTRQHMAILEHLIRSGTHVVVSVNCDEPGSANPAFEKAGHTAAQLLLCAGRWGIPVQKEYVRPRNTDLQPLHAKLFGGHIDNGSLRSAVKAYRTETTYHECVAAAERIMELVREGERYRDIGVVCGDIGIYRNTVSMLFSRCGIPTYLSGTEDILEKSVISTVLTAMEAALNGFEQRDVLRYLRSMLSPLGLDACDRLENYVILWNIRGSGWLKDWEFNPNGLGESMTESAKEKLRQLNANRQIAIEPLIRLQKGFRDALCLKDQILALYGFLEDIHLAVRLGKVAQELDARGDNRNAQILNQLWEILLGAMEQLYDVLGETAWDAETFTRLFKLLLGQYDVGTIPPVLDAVTVGPVSAMRCQQVRHLIVLGAQEGALPGYSGSSGILTDQERTQLRKLGVPLTGGAMEGLQAEFAEIYGVFCGAERSVSISCAGGQPSFIYRRLSDLAGGEIQPGELLGAALSDELEAGAYFARWEAKHQAQALGLSEAYDNIISRRDHQLGNIHRDTVRCLYGDSLRLSASQIDRQAECRLSYFLKYGLKAKERKSASIDPAEFGTYVHYVLEHTAKDIMDMGGFHEVSLEETLKIAGEHSKAYAQEHFKELDSQRIHYLFQRNIQELNMIVQELWLELKDSDFAPVGFEVDFGAGGEREAIDVSGATMNALLMGFVDRVDAWRHGSANYFRVVDYKTGKKDFEYCDVFNGIGLQMLLYLYALEDQGTDVLGDGAIGAGVQYFPARAPLMNADGILSDEEAQQLRQKQWKRKGLLLNNEDVLRAMEDTDAPIRLNYKRKKDGTVSGDLAERAQLRLLRTYVFSLVGKMVDDIASGCVEPNPYTRGSSHSACRFCPYGQVCHPEDVTGRRNYKTMTADRFWEEIEKEMKQHG